MKIFCTLMLLLVSAILCAQTTTGKLRYNGVDYPCYVKSYRVPADVLEKSLAKTMEEKGFKNSGRREMMVYRNVKLDHVHNGQPVDVVIKVEEDKKKDEVISTLNMIVVENGKLHNDKNEKDAARAAAATLGLAMLGEGFHQALDTKVTDTQYEAELAALEADIKKQEKKLSNLDDDKASMLKRIEKLQQDVKDADAEIERTKTSLGEKRSLLDKKKAEDPRRMSKN